MGTAPAKGRSWGVICEKNLVKDEENQRRITPPQTENLRRITRTGKTDKGDQAPLKPDKFLENKIKNKETLSNESGDIVKDKPDPRPKGENNKTKKNGTKAEVK